MAHAATEEEETKISGTEPRMVVESQHALGDVEAEDVHVQRRGVTTMRSPSIGIHKPLAIDTGPENPL
jgi:hypothetical protein